MSSVRPDQVYNEITSALQSDKRVVYNKSKDEFEVFSKSDAHSKDNDSNYVTKLSDLKSKIESFISTYGITDTQKNALQEAFTTRASKLQDRFVLFGTDKRNQAVRDLYQISGGIDSAARMTSTAAKTASVATGAPTPQPLPTAKQSETTPLTESKPSYGTSQPSPPPSPPPLAKAPPQAPSPPIAGGPPPPPMGGPPPPPGGPGAPPPPGGAPRAPAPKDTRSAVQKRLDAGNKLPRLPTEPELPKFTLGDDFGKISTIPKERRDKYIQEIEDYLEGTPRPVSPETKKGFGTKKAPTRNENGLKHAFKKLKEELALDKKDVDELLGEAKITQIKTDEGVIDKEMRGGGLEKDLEDIKREITLLKGDKEKKGQLKELKELNEKEEGTYTVYAGKDTPVVLISDKAYEKYNRAFKQLSVDEQNLLKNEGLYKPPESTIGYRIQLKEKRLQELEKQKVELQPQVDALHDRIKNRKDTISTPTVQGQPLKFEEWKTFLESKEKLINDWEEVLKKLKSESEATAKTSKQADGQADKETKIQQAFDKLSEALTQKPEGSKQDSTDLKVELDSLKAAVESLGPVYQNRFKKPEEFYSKLSDTKKS